MAVAISQDDYLKDTSQFDIARKRAAQQSGANLQARKDALARRFAALGNLDSGARIKQEQVAQNEESQNLAGANEAIDAQQQAELQRRKEVLQGQQFQSGEAEKSRQFARGERLGGQDFAALQAKLGREFSTSERLGGQDFAAEQAGLQRAYGTSEREASQKYATGERKAGQEFATGERIAGQEFAAGEAEKQRNIQHQQFLKQYGLSLKQFRAAQDQFNKTFAEEVRVNDKNIDFAQQALNKKGFLENIQGNLSSPNDFFSKGIKQIGSWF